MAIALGDLSTRIAPEVVVVCEGSAVGTRRKDFDAEIYSRVLGVHFPGIVFVSGGSALQVTATGASLRIALGGTLPTTKIVALCDRDNKSSAEVTAFEVGGDLVLPQRNIESYWLADDALEALVNSEEKTDTLAAVFQLKHRALANAVTRGKPSDDLKSAAGEIYTGLTTILDLRQQGNDSNAFLRDTLAPLIVPGMATYEELKAAIMDRLDRA